MSENTPRVRTRERVRSSSSTGTVPQASNDPSPVPPITRVDGPASCEASKAAIKQNTLPAPASEPANAQRPILSATTGAAAAYEVGYRKPPRNSQFQPGRSGNPKGRPKKHFTIAGALEAELNAKHPITINGRAMHLTQAQIVAKQMCKKAMAGDPRATALIMKFEPVQLRKAFAAEPRSSIEASGGTNHADTATFDAPFSEADRAMMTWFLSTSDTDNDDVAVNAIGVGEDDRSADDSRADDDDDDQVRTAHDGLARRRVP